MHVSWNSTEKAHSEIEASNPAQLVKLLNQPYNDVTSQKKIPLIVGESKKIPTSLEFLPTATAVHPFIFDQLIIFKVLSFSPDGLDLTTTDQSTSEAIVNGTLLNIEIYLPMVGTAIDRIKIENLLMSDGYFYLKCQFSKKSIEIHQLICKYIMLTNSIYSPRSLRSIGFKFTTSSSAVFSYALKRDFSDIAKLRHLSYGLNNIHVSKLTYTDLLDEFDMNAWHLVYKFNEKIVASARAIVNDGIKEKSEIYKKYKASLDVDIWSDSFIEFSKFCVAPDFQKTDISIRLLNQSFSLAYKTKHRFMIITTERKLYNYYIRMGFSSIGKSISINEHNTSVIPMRALVTDLLKNDFAFNLRKFINYGS